MFLMMLNNKLIDFLAVKIRQTLSHNPKSYCHYLFSPLTAPTAQIYLWYIQNQTIVS